METLPDSRIFEKELLIISSAKDDDDTLQKMMGFTARIGMGPGCYEQECVMMMGSGSTSSALRPGSSSAHTSNLSVTISPPSSRCHHYITPTSNLCTPNYISSSKRFLAEMTLATRPRTGRMMSF